MHIQRYTFQLRNDFSAVIQCPHCMFTTELKGGYNDANYHNNVLPAMKCENCGHSERDVVERGDRK